MAGEEESVVESLSEADRARFKKAALQTVACMNFMRWAANFRRDEVILHPQHDSVMLLSPLQSSRFSYAVQNDTVMLGVQHFEAAWMQAMPIEAAYITDRIYLRVREVPILNTKMPELIIGIYVNNSKKLAEMASASVLQPVRVDVCDGQVTTVGRALGVGYPIVKKDIIKALKDEAKGRRDQLDVGRFF